MSYLAYEWPPNDDACTTKPIEYSEYKKKKTIESYDFLPNCFSQTTITIEKTCALCYIERENDNIMSDKYKWTSDEYFGHWFLNIQ